VKPGSGTAILIGESVIIPLRPFDVNFDHYYRFAHASESFPGSGSASPISSCLAIQGRSSQTPAQANDGRGAQLFLVADRMPCDGHWAKFRLVLNFGSDECEDFCLACAGWSPRFTDLW
jgi:hypothetical protein